MSTVPRAAAPITTPLTSASRVRRRHSPEPPAWVGYLFIAPNFLGFVLFTLVPLVFALALAFTRWDVVSGFGGIRWAGLQNFADLAADAKFWESVRLTGAYVGISVPLTLVCGLAAAIALNGPIPGRAALRLIFFIPFIVNAVAISATWLLLYHPRFGPINTVLRTVGVENPPQWFASSQWAMPALIIMAVWGGVGYAAIIYLAALQDMPQDLYEAAELDGAGAWRQFRAITLPFLTPTIFFLAVTGFIGSAQSFGMINLITKGGPGRSTTVLSYYIYQNAFQFYKFGYAAAMALVLFVVVLALTLVLWVAQRRAVFYG